MTRAQLRQCISVDEWTDWLAYYELEADGKKKAQQAARSKGGR